MIIVSQKGKERVILWECPHCHTRKYASKETVENVKTVRDLRKDGWTYQRIAKAMQVSRQYACRLDKMPYDTE